MHGFAGHTLPGPVAGQEVGLVLEIATAYAPGHAVEEEGGARQFLAAEGRGRGKADVPEAILALTGQQGTAHRHVVGMQLGEVGVVGRQFVHHPDQCCIHPPVAAAPVAVGSVLFLVGWHEVLVSPPQAFFLIIEASAALVPAPLVGPHGIVDVASLARRPVHLCIHGHGHLYGIYPRPVVHALRLHLVVEIVPDGLQHALFVGHAIAFQVGLHATLVVGMRSAHIAARRPAMVVGPAVGIVEVCAVATDVVEGHEAFVVDAARPDVAGASFVVDKGFDGGVGVVLHEVCVGLACHLDDAVALG